MIKQRGGLEPKYFSTKTSQHTVTAHSNFRKLFLVAKSHDYKATYVIYIYAFIGHVRWKFGGSGILHKTGR